MKFLSAFFSMLTIATSMTVASSNDLASFYRGVNLAGTAISLDGHDWLAGDDASVRIVGNAFENQIVALIPRTDTARASMLRSSRWGGNLDVELLGIPEGSSRSESRCHQDFRTRRSSELVRNRTLGRPWTAAVNHPQQLCHRTNR